MFKKLRAKVANHYANKSYKELEHGSWKRGMKLFKRSIRIMPYDVLEEEDWARLGEYARNVICHEGFKD